LIEEERSEVGAVKLGIGNGGAEKKAFRVDEFAELGCLRGFHSSRKGRGR
jgi:hypothetical protein